MSFVFPQNAISADKRYDPYKMTKESGRNPGANQNADPKSHQRHSPKLMMSVHKNTPCNNLCRGYSFHI